MINPKFLSSLIHESYFFYIAGPKIDIEGNLNRLKFITMVTSIKIVNYFFNVTIVIKKFISYYFQMTFLFQIFIVALCTDFILCNSNESQILARDGKGLNLFLFFQQ